MMNPIEVSELSKVFGTFTAVNRISFSVRKGEIFGFLGANGAGKSTTIKMLCGLLVSTSGNARVGGFDINLQPDRVKRSIGYMSQRFSLYEDLTVKENIEFFGGVYGLDNDRLRSRRNWAIDMAGLTGRERILARELPGGWKQRLALGCALLHEPPIVFLDEPTGGVDPLSRRAFWELIQSLSDAGTTIFVTTHYLDEAEYCNTIMLIHGGNIIAGGSPRELKSKYITNPMLEVQCSNTIEALRNLQEQSGIIEVSVFGTNLHVSVKEEDKGRELVERILNDAGLNVGNIDRIVPSLEDVFIHLVERETREDGGV